MPLSIGLEIEGVALKPVNSALEFPPESEKQLFIIVESLRRAGLSSRVYLPSSTRGAGPDYSIWNVTMDVTVSELTSGSEFENSKFLRRFGFEIVTPIFRDIQDDAWMAQLHAGLDAVGKAVCWKANRSTGLHVHVGREGDTTKYSLVEVQKIAMFYCRFEAAIDEFHPAHRSEENEYIMSNRQNPVLKDLSISQVYDRIGASSSIEDVCKLVNHCPGETNYDGYHDSRFFKVNFTSLQKHDTIEFRQHEGTVDGKQMIKWIKFITKFVNFAISAPMTTITSPGESFEHLRQLIVPPNN
ncbi:uncharacterized protein FFB20_01826 [Fusarium fujikuroi]|uniref:Amidoligase enzyme n=2 Tax=Fusarium fujikuroi TaxID=5127 RepID=S0EMW6_GIBF5|nr:uncharacterized protein FFUJ_09406 [Fusarium fujikuroi IMI 58289]KLP11359.1 uncharacterized protein Y057_9919 [Fusarium fujikuroi]KLP18101.1 uncharacterized protein LW94_15051 [Fusarium fujikuroi]QGI69393.1 hypothetical protein CEK27_013364 [Fusarium fujikuroi]QGJ00282.1 hypothetical protein CEK26_013350 [Fusarium fujikuroi]CCT73773.1 uncharacterized protein FFUJ_09406 [Fusarium fujikuroi IMI 58289]